MKKRNLAGKPGRPPYDVHEQVYAYVSGGIAAGKTLTEAARKGLVVCDHAGKVLRQFKGKHLESAYRQSERDRIVPWLYQDPGYTHAWPTFMGRPLPVPLGAAVPSERRQGRPKRDS